MSPLTVYLGTLGAALVVGLLRSKMLIPKENQPQNRIPSGVPVSEDSPACRQPARGLAGVSARG